MYAQESIDLLRSSGIKFDQHEERGIDVKEFGEALTSSGIVLSDDIVWISFHSGYDFGYLLKLLTFEPMPEKEGDFYELLNVFFPNGDLTPVFYYHFFFYRKQLFRIGFHLI